MNDIDTPESNLKPAIEVLTKLKSRYYELPRRKTLGKAFDRVLDQFLSAYLAGQHIEGRGLILTGGTRTGKSHDIKDLLRGFAASDEPLLGGFQRNYLRVSLRTTANWRGLGLAFLEAVNYEFNLDHRSTTTIWSRAESRLMRDKYLVVHIDEAQHLFTGNRPREIEVILNGLKDLMKRPGWPILPIYSGVPELLDYANANEQLTSLLEPVTTTEFIRRFLIHILPSGFHRIRHTGFLANGIRRDRIAKIRCLLDAEPEPAQMPDEATNSEPDDPPVHQPCPKCGGAMITVEIFLRGQTPKCRAPPREDAA